MKVLKIKRMRWFGHVVMRNDDKPLAKVGMLQAQEEPHEVDLRRPGGSLWRM